MLCPKTEVWYTWREVIEDEGEGIFTHTRLFIPRADPQLYEFPFDFIFNTPEEAIDALKAWGVDYDEYKDWVLVKETLEPLPTTSILVESLMEGK